MLPEFVALSDGNENDMIEGRKFDFPKGGVVAFDKGYVDYQWFGRLTNQGISFVTRLRPKAVYDVLTHQSITPSKGIISDQIIQLSSAHALKRGAPKLRCVEYLDKENDKKYTFLTYKFNLCASQR